MHIEIGQVVSQIIAFLIMLWVLKRYAWKPLLNTLEQRKNKIATDLSTIEEQKKALASLMIEHNQRLKDIEAQAQMRIQEAVVEGQKRAQVIQEEAHNQAKNLIKKAQEQLQIEILKAKTQLKEEIVHIALTSAQKMIKESLDLDKQNQIISEFVEQMEPACLNKILP